MSSASAPGKIVLWGEYAVLADAPAAVMAVSSRATVSARPSRDEHWHFTSAGFNTEPENVSAEQLPKGPGTAFIGAILRHWQLPCLAHCSTPLNITTDSSDFFSARGKLGLGSSAAVCTATYRLLCQLTGRTPTLSEALAIHKNWQGGKGSGLDVASVWHGGLIHFQQGQATVTEMPQGFHWQIIWSGTSAKTTDHISHFNQWREGTDTGPLDELASLSQSLCDEGPTIARLSDYCDALKTLDGAALLNIFTQEHIRLGTLAAASGVLYKPCGAGGGDIGIAISDDPLALTHFRQQVDTNGFLPLDLETATHGVAFHHGQ
jgi:phosphomevalonate kinase